MPNTEHRTTEAEIKEIWERLTSSEASIKSAHHRIDGLQETIKSIKDLAVSVAQIAIETKALREDSEKTNNRLASLENKPAKRYEAIITVIITALGSGVIGYFLNSILNYVK